MPVFERLPRLGILCWSANSGDKEALAGKPLVGPAGRILDAALKDAGIAREDTFVINAAKHFKHEMRGKRRRRSNDLRR